MRERPSLARPIIGTIGLVMAQVGFMFAGWTLAAVGLIPLLVIYAARIVGVVHERTRYGHMDKWLRKEGRL